MNCFFVGFPAVYNMSMALAKFQTKLPIKLKGCSHYNILVYIDTQF